MPILPKTVEIYDVGPDSAYISEDRIQGADWIVVNYTSGDYCGSGSAVMKCGDKYGIFSLGHCSCYGPDDDIRISDCTLTKEQMLKELGYVELAGRPLEPQDYGYTESMTVLKKIQELLEQTV